MKTKEEGKKDRTKTVQSWFLRVIWRRKRFGLRLLLMFC